MNININIKDIYNEIPPQELLDINAEEYLLNGLNKFKKLQNVFNDSEIDMNLLENILDFGCDTSTVLRHMKGKEIWGVDANRQKIKWCTENMPFNFILNNKNIVHLPFEDQKFDLVYAISVFTEIDPIMAKTWITELSRVIKNGKYLFVTIVTCPYIKQNDRYRAMLNNHNELNEFVTKGQYSSVSIDDITFYRRSFFMNMCSLLEPISIHSFENECGILMKKPDQK